MCFCFNDTATTEIYTLSLHDALPICSSLASASPMRHCEGRRRGPPPGSGAMWWRRPRGTWPPAKSWTAREATLCRSEEHTSELQSRQYLVCRLLLEKKTSAPHSLLHS